MRSSNDNRHDVLASAFPLVECRSFDVTNIRFSCMRGSFQPEIPPCILLDDAVRQAKSLCIANWRASHALLVQLFLSRLVQTVAVL